MISLIKTRKDENLSDKAFDALGDDERWQVVFPHADKLSALAGILIIVKQKEIRMVQRKLHMNIERKDPINLPDASSVIANSIDKFNRSATFLRVCLPNHFFPIQTMCGRMTPFNL